LLANIASGEFANERVGEITNGLAAATCRVDFNNI